MMVRFLLLTLFLLIPQTAKADYYLWEDPKSHFTLTFPDTWKRTSNQNVDDIITVVGPSTNGYPKCVVKTRDDKRYVIFPPSYGRSIQKEAVSTPFWQTYLGEYQDYNLSKVVDDAGLGRWHASYALAGYTDNDGTVFEKRGSIMFASLYYDTMFIVECSALEHAFNDWYFPFMGIIKSVDFKKTYNEIPTGHYRNFLKKAEKLFWFQGKPDGIIQF
ncbi:MAG: hypothetical protein AAF569_06595 [Pseudomonadota bacterium]